MQALSKPTSGATTCVSLSFGEPAFPTIVTLCDASSSVAFGDDIYLPVPTLNVELQDNVGALDEKSFTISIPSQDSQFEALNTFLSHYRTAAAAPPLSVRVFEILSTGLLSQQSIVHLARGDLAGKVKNPDGKRGIIDLEFLPSKASMGNVTLGIPVLSNCVFAFGKAGCGADISQFFDASTYFPNHSARIRRAHVELATYYPQRTQIVDLFMSRTRHPGASRDTLLRQPPRWWIGAYLKRTGLAIPIRDVWYNSVAGAATSFVLGHLPPASWAYSTPSDNTLVLVPGCEKTPAACAARGRTNFFGGFGHGCPSYNPSYDEDDR